jgi:hypothetical protein
MIAHRHVVIERQLCIVAVSALADQLDLGVYPYQISSSTESI